MTPVRNARALATALQSAELRVLPDAGHMLLAERPNDLVEAMSDWIVQVATP
jgi:pimeloyl-ACP methyl ester carboxylesterase